MRLFLEAMRGAVASLLAFSERVSQKWRATCEAIALLSVHFQTSLNVPNINKSRACGFY
jgi:hypothetical protein